MESNLTELSITRSKTSSGQLFEISEEAKAKGLVIRYGSIKYRGHEINFIADVCGEHCAAMCEGHFVDLGLNNIRYKEDMCKWVDRYLDLITEFRDYPNFAGAKLEWFNNSGYRDIRLSYKGRILKVFLVAGEVNETFLISESMKILTTSGLLEEL
jgi:hypothetical protein